jgi:membrane protease YdiL (CAAX protease family)
MILLILPAFTQGVNEGFIWSASRTLVLLACVNVLRNLEHSKLLIIILAIAATASEWLNFFNLDSQYSQVAGFLLFGFFVVMISYEVFKQIIITKSIDMHIIVGAFCGFMLIGIIASLIFTFMHLNNPESFSNVNQALDGVDDLFYFSFITILTIGYGDIAPVTDEARSISLFFGLIGQFYLVVIMAVLVGKFISKAEQ